MAPCRCVALISTDPLSSLRGHSRREIPLGEAHVKTIFVQGAASSLYAVSDSGFKTWLAIVSGA
jgi:hypothetical protein